MATDIGPKIGIQGEKQFRDELSTINTSLKTLTAETKAVTSAFLGNEKSMEALTSKSELLASKSEQLNQKMDLQKARLKELDDQGVDPTSAKYQQLLQQLYNTEAEFEKNEAEIKQNTELLNNNGMTAEEVAKQQEDAAKKAAEAHKKHVEAVKQVTEAFAAMAAAAAAAVGVLGKMVINAGYAADDLNTMAKTTGLSTEELQKFQYASDLIDVSVDTLTGSMTKLTKNMASAKDGSGAAAEAFEALGVSVTDSNGELRDRNEVFNETIKALGKVENETERDAIAMDIFGKSAKDLNPLILGGADALEELGQQAEAAGLILGQDSLDELNKVSDAMDTFKATTSAAGNLFMVGFADPLASGINLITGYLQEMTSAFAEGGWSALGETFGGIMEDLTDKILEYLPKVMELGVEIINNIVLGITDMLPDIIDAAVQIIATLANGLAQLLPELIPKAVDAIITIAETLVDNVDMLIDSAIAIILALAGGLIDNLPRLIAQVPVIITKLVTAIVDKAPELLSASTELMGMFIKGILNQFVELFKAGQDMVIEIKNGLLPKLQEFWEVGLNIVKGIWEGISGGLKWIKDKIKGWVGDVLSFVKGLFGIGSPSKVFAEYGKFLDQGLANGIKDNADYVTDAMASMADATTDAFTPDIAGAINSATSGMVAQIPAPDISMADMLAGTVSGMQGALAGIGGTYTFNLVLPDGTQLARYTLPSLISVARSNGTPILNPT